VTGGSGFIGHHVVARLRARGDEVRVVDLVGFDDPAVDCVTGDLRDPAVVVDAMEGGFDAVVHLAALTSVLASVNDPHGTYETNVAATEHLLEASRRLGVGHFVFASSSAVVGDVGRSPINEKIVPRPLTPYGATKAAGEMLLSAYSGCYGIVTVALRFTNVYGAGMRLKDSVIARLLRAAKQGTGIEIYGDGEQVRDYLYVTDAARAVELGLGLGHSEVVSIGGERSISMNDLHALTCEVTGIAIPAPHTDARPGEMPAVIVDMAHAHELGFEPELQLREGLTAAWEDFLRVG